MPDSVRHEVENGVSVITVNSPPVNALSHPVRLGLQHAFGAAREAGTGAIVLICEGRTFFAGADISEFGKEPESPWLPELLMDIARSEVPVVAAIHGTALGGGLETAMACHYRLAAPSARLGLPEVLLGLLPGAGGTQFAPRLIGIQAALDLMISGKPMTAPAALETGLVDRLADGDLREEALAWARELADTGGPPRRTFELPLDSSDLPAGFFNQVRESVGRKTRGLPAPQGIIDCVEAGTRMGFSDALSFERDRFMQLMKSPESAGLRHVFFAEREAAKINDVPRDTPQRPVQSVGIIGAGTMGGGIAMSFANAGIPVTLLELNDDALQKGLGICRRNYERSAARGRFTDEQVEERMGLIGGTTSYDDLADKDLVIEAVFENPDIKAEVFRKLDEVCKPGAILASNTSYQDIDAIAAVTSRPQDVLGMHFFSPANVMKLLEVVRGQNTAPDVLATVMALARKIRKVAVLSGVCYGFIGNRMFEGYISEALSLVLEGATPAQVDGAMERFGMAMGPLAVIDLAGLDVGYKARQALDNPPDEPYTRIVDRLVEAGRLGQKSGAGFYRYDPETRKRIDDPEVEQMFRDEAAASGIAPRDITDEEIVSRTTGALAAEGRQILEEGIAQRPGDIDIVYIYGYGFPAHRGGPMFYSQSGE
jgi:3-hydroxyacyl-CoA dehydrogenase